MLLNTVRDLDASGKRVFVRVDFNVPLEDGVITDDTRIRAALPTIRLLIHQGARVMLASHLGRPDGMVVDHLRMRPVAQRLERLLGQAVYVTNDCIGDQVSEAVGRLRPGEVLLLENLRFHAEEESNEPAFAVALAANADAYVNDAFGTAHRAHASTVGVPMLLPAYAGLLMEREITSLSRLLDSPGRPFIAILGGAKISDKLRVIDHLVARVDALVLGGGMANTFLAAKGIAIGRSLAEPTRVDDARRILGSAALHGVPIVLPVDAVVADASRGNAEPRIVLIDRVEPDEAILDIGPGTIRVIGEVLDAARTVFWNGPVGISEVPAYAAGTEAVARKLATHARRRRDGGRGRRRLRRGRHAARSRWSDDPRVHWRRSVPRVPRGAGPARGCGAAAPRRGSGLI